MPTITPGHVGVNVTDLDRSVVFYTDLIGLEVIGRSDANGRRYAFLGSAGTVLVTLWQQAEGRFASDRPGLHHLALTVADLEAVRTVEQRLSDAAVEMIHDGVRAHAEGATTGGIWFLDPDGCRLEISTGLAGADTPPAYADGPTCGLF